MEHVKPSSSWRGPYETLTGDPAALRSPSPTTNEVLVDVERTVHDVKTSAIEGEDLATATSPADEATTHLMADEAVAAAAEGRVVCVACPRIYLSLRRSYPARQADVLIDFDPRFQSFGENTVITPIIESADKLGKHLPPALQHSAAVVVMDMSFMAHLSIPEVIEVAELLAKRHEPLRLELLAPAAVAEAAATAGLKPAAVQPHTRPGLAPLSIYTTLPQTRFLH